jgi:4-hydroxy-4-methyl-2-oxoglutarate aldolase
MGDKGLVDVLSGLPTGNLCNAHSGVRAMNAAIVPLYQGAKLAGPARTAAIVPGHNAGIHRALARAKPGQVLVVDGGGSRLYGPFGDILASACKLKGITGLVIDSTIRDVAEIRAMNFPVFCLGANPSATQKTDPGEIDVPVVCAGVRVAPGDYIVGDADGVVVIQQDIAREVARSALAIVNREEEIRAELREGKTTCEILNIPV